MTSTDSNRRRRTAAGGSPATRDLILEGFLSRQREEGLALARASDLLELLPFGPPALHAWVARFRCKGLVRKAGGSIGEADYFEIGIRFPDDYLRRAEPAEVLTWLGPPHIFHPNIAEGSPFICIGRLAPGTPLVDLLYRCFDVITFNNVTMREDDALNRDACAWARRNRARFPVDTRPLKRRVPAPDVDEAARPQT